MFYDFCSFLESYDVSDGIAMREMKANGLSTNQQELEKQMIDEMHAIFKKYREKMTDTLQDKTKQGS
jgi:hypothetical protein